MRMIAVALVFLSSFALSGCLTISPETADKIKAASLKQCQSVNQLEAAYTILKEGGELSSDDIKKGDIVFGAINTFCASSQSWDPDNAAVEVALLYLRVTQFMKQIG